MAKFIAFGTSDSLIPIDFIIEIPFLADVLYFTNQKVAAFFVVLVTQVASVV